MFAFYPQKGLSLIEFLVAIGISIVLVIIAVPVFTDLYREHRLNTQIQNLYYVLQYARSEAMRTNQTVFVNFQTGNNWCYGLNAGAICTCSTANSCGLGTYAAPNAEQLTLSATGLSGGNISFEGTRGAAGTASSVTFTLFGAAPAITIKISTLGNLTYCSSSFSGYDAC